MINLMQAFSMYQQLRSNPMQFLRGMGIPESMANNPQQIIQEMLNRNIISQQQLNDAMAMRNNPMFKGLFKN